MRVDDDVIGKLTFEEALKLLSEDERDILNMRLGMDMTFREISRAVGKPLGTVTWKYRQAVFKLKKTIRMTVSMAKNIKFLYKKHISDTAP